MRCFPSSLSSACFLLGPLLAFAGCERPPSEQARVSLLAPPLRGGSSALALPAVDLDFRLPDSHELLFPWMVRLVPGRDGLDLTVRGEGPQLTLNDPVVGVRALVVELRNHSLDALALWWAPRGEPPVATGAEVPIAKGPEFASYRFELPGAATASPRGVVLRLQLIGAPAERSASGEPNLAPDLTLRSFRFETAPGAVAAPATPVVGKFRIGRELRLAANVASGSRLTLAVPPEARQLTFGVARRSDGAESCALEVALEGGPAGRKVLLAATLTRESSGGWRDYSVQLSKSGVARELRFEPSCPGQAGAGGWAGAVYVATPELRVARPARGPDIVLVSLDTVSAPAFDEALASGRAPAFARLAQRGVRFVRARTNSSVTSTSHASMLSGRLPAGAGLLRAEHGLVVGPTLAELLRAGGYSTAAFTGGLLVHERFGFDRGFDRFAREDSFLRLQLEAQTDVGAVAARATDWLARPGGGPRFLFLHSYEAHTPYLREPPYASRPEWHALRVTNVTGRLPFSHDRLPALIEVADRTGRWQHPSELAVGEEALALARETYLAEIARLDRWLGPPLERFVVEASARGAVLAVVADHGEALFEDGLVQHGLLDESNLRVPLLLVAPGLPAGVERDWPAHNVDLLPTLLELAGVEPPRGLDGRSLVAVAKGEGARARPTYAFTFSSGFAWELGTTKWITPTGFENENLGHQSLFDLGADPLERDDRLRAGERPDEALVALALATWNALPGLHLDLSPLGGRVLDVDAIRAELAPSGLHGWDLRPVAPDGHRVWRRRLQLGPTARLWWLAPDLGDHASLELADPATGARCHVVRAPDATDEAPFALQECRRAFGVELRAHRVAPPPGSEAGDAPSDAELERLRALGYLH